jgi:hypothetical protein
MNNDYLWDKRGEPDPQIQELESILGALRYQPRPLRLAPQRHYIALLAIAASIGVALLGGGLWLLLQNGEASIPSVAIDTAPPARSRIDLPLPVASQPPIRRKPTLPAKHDNREALAAKQQLMFALRIASEKLNTAYRRTQTPSQIKNQHKAG